MHRITAPTLVAIAESDPTDLVAISAEVAAAVQAAKTVRFAETGHLIAMERPDETAELILGFLAASVPDRAASTGGQDPPSAAASR